MDNAGSRTAGSRQIAIACQGGGSHAAYTAGALQTLLPQIVRGDGSRERFRLVGISGTSGGAICALVAWYGMLMGGAAEASRRLADFWNANATQRPLERLHNYWLTSTLDIMPFELQLSPYTLPLFAAERMATQVWPWAASWWPLGALMRAEYFQLDKLISDRVDFKLVEKLGLFWSVARLLERWEITALRPQACPELIKWEKQSSLEQEILKRLSARTSLQQAAQESPHGLLALAFRTKFGGADDKSWNPAADALVGQMQATLDGGGHFTAAQATALKEKVEGAMYHIPLLLLGAVDIGTGEFAAFSSECAAAEGGITENSTLASACLPWIFPATELVRQVEPAEEHRNSHLHMYWDGLFSQNPPIKDFISGRGLERKPSEILAIQINPQRTEKKFEVASHIWDRRNELAGNLSLNQEIAFINAINQRLDLAKPGTEGIQQESEEPRAMGIGREDDQHIRVLRLPLDSERLEREWGAPLGPASKLDRNARLKDLLMDFGRGEASAFLPVRDFIQDYWNARGQGQTQSAQEPETQERTIPSDLIAAVRCLKDAPLKVEHCLVDDIEIRHRGAVATDRDYDVTVRWHAWSTGGDARLLVGGLAEFRVEDGRLAGGAMNHVWVTDRRAAVAPAAQGDAAAPGRSTRRRTREHAPLEYAGARPERARKNGLLKKRRARRPRSQRRRGG